MRGDGALDSAAVRPGAGLGTPPRPRLIASAHDESAQSVFTGVQWVLFVAALACVALLLTVDAPMLAELTHDVLVVVFLSIAAWRVFLCLMSAPPGDPPRLPDDRLPDYTLICPMYREAGMVADLAAALDRLDYPRDRLQALFVLEADDEDTRVAAAEARLPGFVRVVIAPPGLPRTKPRACNIALAHATGELAVIYDAEDRPDPAQLREAAARFAVSAADVACLQAPLRIGPTRTFLHRQFALEYAAQFEVTLNAMARLRLPFPLGGTSNHFRTERLRQAGGWDPWNVTEDADMGFRFAARGWRVETLRSATWETPPDTLSEWIPQRTRWLKGYMQTWTVRTRRPWVRGWKLPFGLLVTLGKAIGSAVVHGLIAAWLALQVLLAAMSGDVSDFRMIDVAVLVGGWWAWCLTARIGARRAGFRVRTSDYFGVLLYWPAQTLAAARALWQLIVCPFHWDKTPHRPLAEFISRWTRTVAPE